MRKFFFAVMLTFALVACEDTTSTTTETTTVQDTPNSVDVLKDLLEYNGTELQEKLQKNTCVELRNVLKQCKLSTVGKKQVLINKLVNHITHQNKYENEVATN